MPIISLLIWINNNLGTVITGIAASIFAYYQIQINNKEVEITLARKYQEHFIHIQNLLLKIRYDLNLITDMGEIAINNNLRLWDKILLELNIIYSESQLFCDDEIEKINLEFFNNILSIRNEMAKCVEIEKQLNSPEELKNQIPSSKQRIAQTWGEISINTFIGTPIGNMTVAQKMLILYRKRTQKLSLQPVRNKYSNIIKIFAIIFLCCIVSNISKLH